MTILYLVMKQSVNNSRAVFKPEYRNFHIKATNDAFIQNVSIFAIGYAEQFVTESGRRYVHHKLKLKLWCKGTCCFWIQKEYILTR